VGSPVVEERTFKQFEDLALCGFPAVVVFVLVVLRFGHVDGIEPQLEVFVGGVPAGSDGCPHQPGGFDDTEPSRWVDDLGSALGHLE
jgi:hypothetical protein